MAHAPLKDIEAETAKASTLLIGTMLGGLFVVASFLVEIPVVSRVLFQFEPSADSSPYAAGIALIGALMLGLPLIWHAVKHLGHGHMDELVALAIVAAIALGDYQEAGIVAFFMVISNLIETRTALGARASIESLLRPTPDKAHRLLADGKEELVEASELSAGQTIRVRPGDNIPADGEIIVGGSTINQANITGIIHCIIWFIWRC